MSEIKIDDICVGSVSKFAGDPPARRWIAFSIHRPQPDVENTRGFATRKAANDWLEAETI